MGKGSRERKKLAVRGISEDLRTVRERERDIKINCRERDKDKHEEKR